MSIGLVRRFVRESPSVRPARGLVALAALAALSACSDGSLSGPEGRLVADADGRATGPSGLEQRVVTKVEPPQAGSGYTAFLTATSTLVNTGTAPVRVTARVCLAMEDDIETTAQMNRFEPLISCGAVSMTTDLAPGASTSPLQVQFGVRSGPGEYTLKFRHSLSPEFRANVAFRIP